MSYFKPYWQTSRDPRAEHEKAWRRAQATAWDEKWRALSIAARQAYLTDIKAPSKEGSYTQPFTLADRIPARVVEELTAAGLVKVEPASGKKSARIMPLSAAYDFSTRLRSMSRYNLLGPTNRENLAKYVKYAFSNQGETVINRVLTKAGVDDHARLDEGLELYVTTNRWPEWALQSIESKWARPLLDALRKADGPVRLVDLPGLVEGAKAEELREALTDLVVHLAVFEDVNPGSLDLVVGLLPIVRDRLAEAGKPRKRPPLVVSEKPKEVGPIAGLAVNDLRVFLLEVAGESPRLRQDGGIFQKEEPRFLEALPPHPAWLDDVLKSSKEHRLGSAYLHARTFGFVESEPDDRTRWLRLTGKGRNWLASGLEEQYAKVYEQVRATSKKRSYNDYDYDDDYGYSFGDSKFLGVPVSVAPATSSGHRYYYYEDAKPEQRDALRKALLEGFEALPVGVFHRWDNVVGHLAFGEHNPLTLGSDPSKVTIYLDRRQVPRLPEQVELAGKLLLEAFLRYRLLPFDAVRPAIDDEGKLCIARLPRLVGLFGLPYESGEDEASAATRVIVQPDFSLMVIGLDPAPAAELAPFSERVSGHAGNGVLTFKITRESVIRAASQGLTATAIVARLKKHASVDVPENVLQEVKEWAGWVRLVNIRQVTVVRCPDREAVARVVSVLGKKTERLGDTLVALHVPKLAPAERQKLQDQGILITKDDITIAREPRAVPDPSTPAPPKKRGRPRKAR